MSNLFHPAMNTVSRLSILGIASAVFLILLVCWLGVRSSYVTGTDVALEQPIPFSHQHHVSDVGIDCRYCHTSVEDSSFAGIPSTEICMNCHAFLFSDQPMLEPVRRSFRTGKPIAWNRVHDLPDFANFNHSIHVAKGVGCVSCHGPVDRMPLIWQEHSLLMQWCLDCHWDPVPNLRPKEFVFHMKSLEELAETSEFRELMRREFPGIDPADPDLVRLRLELADRYGVQSKTSCSYCHY